MSFVYNLWCSFYKYNLFLENKIKMIVVINFKICRNDLYEKGVLRYFYIFLMILYYVFNKI